MEKYISKQMLPISKVVCPELKNLINFATVALISYMFSQERVYEEKILVANDKTMSVIRDIVEHEQIAVTLDGWTSGIMKLQTFSVLILTEPSQ
jgi:hypothetical protein